MDDSQLTLSNNNTITIVIVVLLIVGIIILIIIAANSGNNNDNASTNDQNPNDTGNNNNNIFGNGRSSNDQNPNGTGNNNNNIFGNRGSLNGSDGNRGGSDGFVYFQEIDRPGAEGFIRVGSDTSGRSCGSCVSSVGSRNDAELEADRQELASVEDYDFTDDFRTRDRSYIESDIDKDHDEKYTNNDETHSNDSVSTYGNSSESTLRSEDIEIDRTLPVKNIIDIMNAQEHQEVSLKDESTTLNVSSHDDSEILESLTEDKREPSESSIGSIGSSSSSDFSSLTGKSVKHSKRIRASHQMLMNIGGKK